jgi:proliferating cell nuclear antigen PCNA
MTLLKVNRIEKIQRIVGAIPTQFKEVLLDITEREMTLFSVDDSNSCLFICSLNTNYFDEFIYDKNIQINLNTSQLNQIIKSSKQESKLELNFTEKILGINIYEEYIKKYRLLNLDRQISIKIPKIQLDVIVNINTNRLYNVVKETQVLGEMLYINAIQDRINFHASGVTGDVNIILSIMDSQIHSLKINQEIMNIYNIQDLVSFLKSIVDYFNICEITMQKDGPIKIEISFENGLISYYLAPTMP